MPNLIGFINKVSFHTFLELCLNFSPSSSSSSSLLLSFSHPVPPNLRPIWSLKSHSPLGLVWPFNKTHFWVNFLYLLFGPPTLGHLYFNFLLLSFGLKSFHIRTFKPLFGPITKLSLSFVTFRVSRFPVSHLTYATIKLGLQNTLNMSKTTRVYFGMLQTLLLASPF